MKNMALPVAVAVAIIGCVLAVSANVTTTEIKKDLDQERYKRMLAEEQLQKAKNTIKQYKVDLVDARSKISSIEEILNLGQSANTTLKAELEKAHQERALLMNRVRRLQREGAPAEGGEVP